MNLNRKKREKQRYKEEILKASEKIFARKGFHDTTIQDIAKEAEFSVGYIYNFFKSKEDLYKSLTIHKFDVLINILKNIYLSKNTPKQKLINIIDSLLNIFENDTDFIRIYVRETRGQTWNVKKFLEKDFIKNQKEGQKYITSIIQDGIKQKLFIKANPVDLMLSITGILNAFIIYWIENSISLSLREKSKIIQDILFKGIELKGVK